jgi:hypothetical protein
VDLIPVIVEELPDPMLDSRGDASRYLSGVKSSSNRSGVAAGLGSGSTM